MVHQKLKEKLFLIPIKCLKKFSTLKYLLVLLLLNLKNTVERSNFKGFCLKLFKRNSLKLIMHSRQVILRVECILTLKKGFFIDIFI